jgi:hypothetical protein
VDADSDPARQRPICGICALIVFPLAGIVGTIVMTARGAHPGGWKYATLFVMIVVIPSPLVLLLSVASLIRNERPLLLAGVALLASLPGAYFLLLFASSLP